MFAVTNSTQFVLSMSEFTQKYDHATAIAKLLARERGRLAMELAGKTPPDRAEMPPILDAPETRVSNINKATNISQETTKDQ